MKRRLSLTTLLLVVAIGSCSTSDDAVADPKATYDGSACTYEGPTEFDVGSTVTFTLVNVSDSATAGFALWHIPDGTTVAEVEERGIFAVVEDAPAGTYGRLDPNQFPAVPGEEYEVAFVFDPAGQYAINCFDQSFSPTQERPIMLTVNDG
jgi:hypothetical protein